MAGASLLSLVACAALALLLPCPDPVVAAAGEGGFSERDVTFESGAVTLSGSVLLPDSPDRVPGLVLVHGAGPHRRDSLRVEAEAFARLGVAALIYDKRTDGYSQVDRSYALLADDALAAVALLRAHPRVDAEAVGLWGLSEGAWVAPLAAARSGDVAFVVTVGAAGISPLRQTSWALENTLDKQGVRGSLRRTVTMTGLRVLAGIGVFPEADFDPAAALARLDVPLLALWGAHDRTAPAAESARVAARALDRPGGPPLSVRVFPGADHDLRAVEAGAGRHALAPGYAEAVADWIAAVAGGRALPAASDTLPEQGRTSRPLAPLQWWESAWAQLAAVAIPAAAFVAHPLGGAVAGVRRALTAQGVTGLAAILGFHGYYGYLVFTNAAAVGPLLGGRPLAWLALQLLAVLTCGLTALLAVRWIGRPEGLAPVTRRWLGLAITAGVVFAGWAAYWGLLTP